MERENLQATKMPNVSMNTQLESKNTDKEQLTTAEIQKWLVTHIAELLEVDPDEIELTAPFDLYGLDSSAAIGLSGELEEWLGKELDPTLLYDYPTIKDLAQHLAEECK